MSLNLSTTILNYFLVSVYCIYFVYFSDYFKLIFFIFMYNKASYGYTSTS